MSGVALMIGPSEELKTNSIKWVRDAARVGSEVFGIAAGYLGLFARQIRWWEAAGIVSKLFIDGPGQTGVIGVQELIRGIATAEGLLVAFSRAIRIVWDKVAVPHRRRMIGAGASVPVRRAGCETDSVHVFGRICHHLMINRYIIHGSVS
jgi:hypothetical protein